MSLLEEPCRRCRATEAWLLRPVLEADDERMVVEYGPLPDVIDDVGIGWYEAALCAGCGHAQFWAREYRPERAPVATAEACAGCEGRTAWTIDDVPDVVGGLATPMVVKAAPTRWKPSLMFGGRGLVVRLRAHVCAGCGLTDWSCRAEPHFPEDIGDGKVSPRACARCAGRQSVARLRDWCAGREESYDLQRAVHRRRGRFVVDVCRSCWHVDWYGMELDELEADEKHGLFALARVAAWPQDGGPYR